MSPPLREFFRLSLLLACLLSCAEAAWLCAPACAQSIRDVVRDHVGSELEPERSEPKKPDAKKGGKKDEPKKKTAAKKPTASAERAQTGADRGADPAADGGIVLSTDAPASKGPKLPQRVLGEDLRIDLRLGAGYRGWVPQQYDSAEVEAGSYYVWTFDVRAKIFRFLNLRRGYYESNALAGPRTDEAAVAAEIGSYVPKAAWLLAVLGFPIFKVWEPILRYESRAFETKAKPAVPVCVVTEAVENDLGSCVRSTEPLRLVSGFETLVIGVRYDQAKDKSALVENRSEKLPPLTFGVGLMSYRKPYQVTVGDSTLSEYLFDGRFRGAGLVFGTEAGGGPDRLYIDLDTQFGLGEVLLTKNVTLNSLAPEDWLIGYVQGNVTIGYQWPILRTAPTLMLVPSATGGGAGFFFFKTDSETGDESDSTTLNWDFLWTLHVALVLSL